MMSDTVLNGIGGGGMSVQVMFLACNINTHCATQALSTTHVQMFAGPCVHSYRMLAALHCRRATRCKHYASSTMEKNGKEKKRKEKKRKEKKRKEKKRKEKKRKEKKRKEKKRKDYAFRRQFIEKAKYYTGLPRDPQQCINDAANTATLALKQKGYNNMRKTVKSKSHWPCKLAAESGSGHKQALAMCDAAAGKGDS